VRDFPPPERLRDVFAEDGTGLAFLVPCLLAVVFYRPTWFLIVVGVIVAGIVVDAVWRRRRRRERLRKAQEADAESPRLPGRNEL